MNNDQNTPPKGNAPIDTLWDGSLKLAIFRNQRENGFSYSMEPGRIYTDSEGNVRESKTFSGSEPIRMSKLLDKGYDRVAEFKQQMRNHPQKRDRER